MTGTSSDFLHWTDPVFLEYPDAPKEHLYTNAILPHPRAPYLLVGFPTRFHPERGQQVEPTLMSSRDGETFHRWLEPLIPVTAPEDREGNRSNYMAWGMVRLPDEPRHYSLYATEAYYTGPDSRVRRFTIRLDGFVSLHAAEGAGELVTPPLRFSGDRLEVNYSAAKGGSLRVELQDAEGHPIERFALDDCDAMTGDEIAANVRWSGRTNVGSLADQSVRIRFRVDQADLFSFRFAPGSP
jgi:hypothetical protein